MQNVDEKSCYRILDVTKQATNEEIKKAYHRAARKYHPDLNPNNPEIVEKFKEVTEAYRLIIELREKPDKFSKVKNIFNGIKDIRNEPDIETDPASNSIPHEQPQKGDDIFVCIEIAFFESLLGCKKRISISRMRHCECCYDGRPTVGCSVCGGTGKVLSKSMLELQIPRRVKNEQVLKIIGKGNVGDIGAPDGDISIQVKVIPDDHYVLKGNDVYYRLDLTFPEASMGVVKAIQTAQGTVQFNIPCGILSGTKIRLKGKGLPDETTGEFGDQYIITKLLVPVADSEEKRELMREVQKVMYETENYFDFD